MNKSTLIVSLALFLLVTLGAEAFQRETITDTEVCEHVTSKSACNECCKEVGFESGYGMATYGNQFSCICMKETYSQERRFGALDPLKNVKPAPYRQYAVAGQKLNIELDD